MSKHTAQILFEACALDSMPERSPAALVDFGLDGWGGTNPGKIYTAYVKAVRSGVTLEQLAEAVGNGPKLSLLIGVTVKTVWDEIENDDSEGLTRLRL